MAYSQRKVVRIDSGSVKGVVAEGVTSKGISVTIADNPGRLSVIVFTSRGGGSISSITRDGKSYTQAIKSTVHDGNFTEIWYSTSPTKGTSTATVTFGSVTATNAVILGHVGMYNVDQINPVNLTDEQVGNAGNFSNGFTPTLDDCIAIDGQHNSGNTTNHQNAEQTLVYRREASDSCGISYEPGIDATSENMGWSNFVADSSYSQALAVFQPAKKPKGGIHLFASMMGM